MRDSYLFVILIAVYGVAIAIGGWFVMPADRRHRFQGRLQSLMAAFGTRMATALGCAFQRSTYIPSRLAARVQEINAGVVRHRYAAAFALAILLMPAIAVQLFASRTGLEGYEDLPQATDPVIAALLRGERLVAPAPLPPELFVTRELEAERQEIAGASREWTMLEADFRQRLLAVYQLMAQHGYQMALLEGYRSPQRQAALAQLGPHVTNAGTFQSYHQFGLAADSAFYRDGKIVISEKDPWAMEGYRLYGQYAASVGLVWGGNWQMMDFGHVELRKPGVLARR